MGGDSRYDKSKKRVSGTEAEEAQALHAVAGMLKDYPDAVRHDLRAALANVLHAGALELNAGRAVPLEIRRAIRRLATTSSGTCERRRATPQLTEEADRRADHAARTALTTGATRLIDRLERASPCASSQSRRLRSGSRARAG